MILAVALIVLGIVAFAYTGVRYAEGRGLASAPRRVPMSPIVGVVALVSGLAVLFVSTESPHRFPSA